MSRSYARDIDGVNDSPTILGAPLRSLTPIVNEEIKFDLQHRRDDSSELETQIRDAAYISAPGRSLEGTKVDPIAIVNANPNAFSPTKLFAEYATELKANKDGYDQSQERSHLYETGEHSDVLKSISKGQM